MLPIDEGIELMRELPPKSKVRIMSSDPMEAGILPVIPEAGIAIESREPPEHVTPVHEHKLFAVGIPSNHEQDHPLHPRADLRAGMLVASTNSHIARSSLPSKP